jgi:hypothetical protein
MSKKDDVEGRTSTLSVSDDEQSTGDEWSGDGAMDVDIGDDVEEVLVSRSRCKHCRGEHQTMTRPLDQLTREIFIRHRHRHRPQRPRPQLQPLYHLLHLRQRSLQHPPLLNQQRHRHPCQTSIIWEVLGCQANPSA